MSRLIAIEARGPKFVDALVEAWARGDAVAPIDPRLPASARRALEAALRIDQPVEAGTALVIATSGTTGTPKGVVLSHDHVAASADATSDRLGVDPATDRWVACLPLSHVGGLSVVTRAIHTKTSLEVHDGFDADVVDRAAAAGATHISLVATALRRIDPAPWKQIVLGGSAPPRELPANVATTYGATETGSGVVYDGVPLRGVEVAVVDNEIRVRGPMIGTSYRDGRPIVDRDGWFHTGDLGAWDGTRLHVSGRRSELIITGGENVWPSPVEARLDAHPLVQRAAVIGTPDAEWGEVVVALVEPTDAGTPPRLDELRSWVKETLPAFCAPKRLEIVETIPVTALGKIRRGELSALSPRGE